MIPVLIYLEKVKYLKNIETGDMVVVEKAELGWCGPEFTYHLGFALDKENVCLPAKQNKVVMLSKLNFVEAFSSGVFRCAHCGNLSVFNCRIIDGLKCETCKEELDYDEIRIAFNSYQSGWNH